MELGKGYAFVARQQHIHTEKQDYFLDLVFYNYILKCFVLIDLKTEKITHQDVGQMNMYIRMYDSAFYKRKLKLFGVRLISVLENLDDSLESIILESVLEGMAEYYSRNLAREVMKGMRETAFQGKHTGGCPPLGYNVNTDKQYEINELEAESVRLIFEMYTEGYGYNVVLQKLHDKGFKTKTGKAFGKNSLYSILSNEKYAGIFVFNKTERKLAGKRNAHKLKKDEEIIRIENGIPPIIDKITWEKAKEKMLSNKHKQAAYTAKAIYLLTGRIFCGTCHGAMLGKHGRTGRNKTEYSYYECGTRKRTHACDMKPINKNMIETLVINTLYEHVLSPAAIQEAAKKIYEHALNLKDEIPANITTAQKNLTRINVEIDNLVNAIAKGMYHESMKKKMDELKSQKSYYEIQIENGKNHAKSIALSYDQIVAFLEGYAGIRDMPPVEQKAAVELFVNKVVVYNDYIDVDIRPWF